MKRDLALVALALFIWGIGEGLFFYLQPVYLKELGAGPLLIGTILGGYGVAMAVAHIPAGYLADRFGRRPLMWASWLLGVIAVWIMALAPGLPVFVIGLLAYGLTLFVLTPMNSYITAARGSWTVGRALTLVSAAFNLGMVFGSLLSGWTAEQFGLRSIFAAAGCIFIVSTVLILQIRPQPVEHGESGERRLSFLRNPHHLTYLGVVFLAALATYLAMPLSQNFLVYERGLTYGTIGILTALTGLGVVTLNFFLGSLDARLGFLLAQAATGGFALLMWQGGALPWYFLAYFLMGGYKTARSLMTAQTRALVSARSMGLAYGVTETTGALATILAPVLAGALYTREPALVYAAAVVLILASLLVSARFAPRPALTPVPEPAAPPAD